MARVEWTRIDRDDLEHLVAMLLCRENPAAQRIRASAGDGGIDVLVPLGGDDGLAIYQAKAFSANLTSSQKEQIEHSYRRLKQFASDRELKISKWYLTLPLDGTHENHMWLATITNTTNDYEQWRGLAYLDGLAAKFPEVVDYYLADGRDRLQQAMQSLAAAIGIGGFPPPTELTGGSSIDGLAGIHETINKCDPHYRYDFAVSGTRPPLPADENNLVAAVQVERERVWVTFKIFAKCIESLRERPIPFNLSVDLRQAPPQLREELHNFHQYGLPATAPAGTVDFVTDLPGGLGGAFSGGSATLGPIQVVGGSTYQLRLRVLKPDGEPVSETLVDMAVPTTGVSGQGFGARGVERNGVFALRILTDLETNLIKLSLEPQDLTGISPIDAIPALRLVGAFTAPNLMQIAQPYGPPDTEAMPIPAEGGAIDLDELVVAYVEALAQLQSKTSVQLKIPNFDLVTRKEALELIEAARLLRGEGVKFRWSQVPVDLHSPPTETPTESITLLLRQQLNITVEGTPIHLGLKQVYFPSAVLDIERSDLSAAKAVFVPYEDLPAQTRLLDDSVPAVDTASGAN
jgi:hypothetical protein